MTPETIRLVENLITAMESLTSAEAQGDELARRRAEKEYKALMELLRERSAQRYRPG